MKSEGRQETGKRAGDTRKQGEVCKSGSKLECRKTKRAGSVLRQSGLLSDHRWRVMRGLSIRQCGKYLL